MKRGSQVLQSIIVFYCLKYWHTELLKVTVIEDKDCNDNTKMFSWMDISISVQKKFLILKLNY